MFNFKNKYEPRKNWDPNDHSTYSKNSLPPGLSKYWRYTTLDAQNNNNNYNNNSSSSNTINKNIQNNYPFQGNCTSPDDITLEISYDNFYTLGVDMMKKKKYAEELKKQIEEKEMRKKLERQKKKLDDLKDDIRIEKERKKIEDRQRENNKRFLPKINMSPYYPPKQIQTPIKLLTPPPIPSINQIKSPKKPKINIELNKNYSHNIPRIKYVYRKIYNTEETKNFLREREEGLERFNEEMRNQLKMLKNDFNYGMKQLNDEVDNLNNGIKDKNHNFRYLIQQKVNDLSSDIQKNNNKKLKIQAEHIYNFIRKTKDGKSTIQRFTSEPNFVNFPSIDGNEYTIKTPKSFNGENIRIINDDNFYDELSNNIQLPYINLSHCISYS